MRPNPDPRDIIRSAENWQAERNADSGYRVTTKEAALYAAAIGPFMLRQPSSERCCELLDAVGDHMDVLENGPDITVACAESRAINAAWRVGGEMP